VALSHFILSFFLTIFLYPLLYTKKYVGNWKSVPRARNLVLFPKSMVEDFARNILGENPRPVQSPANENQKEPNVNLQIPAENEEKEEFVPGISPLNYPSSPEKRKDDTDSKLEDNQPQEGNKEGINLEEVEFQF
jgi:hypothetical protein